MDTDDVWGDFHETQREQQAKKLHEAMQQISVSMQQAADAMTSLVQRMDEIAVEAFVNDDVARIELVPFAQHCMDAKPEYTCTIKREADDE